MSRPSARDLVARFVQTTDAILAKDTRLPSLFWCTQQTILALHHGMMKIQERRRLERDRQTTMPLRPNPKRAESSNQAIQDPEIRRTPPRAIEDQQLVFGQNRFRDDGSHTAWLKYAHDRSHDMDKEENQITHTRL